MKAKLISAKSAASVVFRLTHTGQGATDAPLQVKWLQTLRFLKNALVHINNHDKCCDFFPATQMLQLFFLDIGTDDRHVPRVPFVLHNVSDIKSCLLLLDLLAAKAKAKRPPNSFMIWGHQNRGLVAQANPNPQNCEVSTLLGQIWADLPAEACQPYYDEALQASAAPLWWAGRWVCR